MPRKSISRKRKSASKKNGKNGKRKSIRNARLKVIGVYDENNERIGTTLIHNEKYARRLNDIFFTFPTLEKALSPLQPAILSKLEEAQSPLPPDVDKRVWKRENYKRRFVVME